MAASNNCPKHHIKGEICATRKNYRDGRRDTAVKVFTVHQESRYLLVQGAPALGGSQDLIKLFALYGDIEEYRILDNYPAADQYTDVFWIKFKEIQSARVAKRKMDDFNYLGNQLHVCYCPEYETVDDTRQKLQQRRMAVAGRIRNLKKEAELNTEGQPTLFTEAAYDTKKVKPVAFHSKTIEEEPRVPNHPSIVDDRNFTMDLENQQGPLFHLQQRNYLALPPPPQHIHPSLYPPKIRRLEHARVPSAHATLPSDFSPWKNAQNDNESHDKPRDERSNLNNNKMTSISGEQAIVPVKEKSDDFKMIDGYRVKEYETKAKQKSRLVAKTANKLLLMPRQLSGAKNKVTEDVLKKSKGKMPVKKSSVLTSGVKSTSGDQKTETDVVKMMLQKNALTLGETKGPSLPPASHPLRAQMKDKTPADNSIDKSRQAIKAKLKALLNGPPSKKPKLDESNKS